MMRRLTVLLCGGIGLPGLLVSGVQPMEARSTVSGETATVRMAQTFPEQETELTEVLRQVTVRIEASNNQGSGTLLAKQGTRYLVLTNHHVVRGQQQVKVQTADGQTHTATVHSDGVNNKNDLALLEFSSTNEYATPVLGNDFTPRPDMNLLVGGYSAASRQFQSQTTQIGQVLSKPLKQGYQIGYGGTVSQGMSGGPIFQVNPPDQGGYTLIGINGVMAYPIRGNYEDEAGQQPTLAEQKQLEKLNWGIPLLRVLGQIPEPIATAYRLPFPEVTGFNPVADSQNVGWVAELEKKARLFTVKIDSSSGANGSGVIVGRNGSTYTVVTAAHVVCERPQGGEIEEPCPKNEYRLETHDGRLVSLNQQRFQIREGLDLAIVQFESEETYPIATVARSKVQSREPVFAAGFPKVSELQGSPWQFNSGLVFEQQQGVLQVKNYTLRQSQGGLAVSGVAQSTFGEGYELVYTSQTRGGMSGGPVLDHEGRVVGIHGLAEGEAKTPDGDIQLGYSLGIPSQTLVGVLESLRVPKTTFDIRDESARELTSQEVDDFNQSLVSFEAATLRRNAKDWIELGNQYWRADRNTEALTAFDQAIAQRPEYVYLAWYGKSLVLFESDDFKGSIEAAKQATQANPDYLPAWKQLATVYRFNQEYELGLEAIDVALQKQPEDPSLWNEKGRILSYLQRYEEALMANNQAITLAKRPAFLSNRGITFGDLQRYEEALKDFNQALTLDPKFTQAYNNRGIVFDKLQRDEEALKDFNQAIDLDPKFASAYTNRGAVFDKFQRYEEALKDFNQAIDLNPKLASAYDSRGIVFSNLQRYEEAIKDHNQALILDPKFTQSYINRGALFASFQRYEEALQDFNQALTLDPKNTMAYYNRGTLLFSSFQRHEEALQDFNQALTLDPKNTQAYINRGALFASFQRHEEALQDFNQALALDPIIAQAYNNRGTVFAKLQRNEEALQDFNQALTLAPQDTSAYYNRGLVFDNLQRYEEALQDYSQVLTLDPRNAQAYFSRGFVFAKLQRNEEALQDFNQALTLAPTAIAHLARGFTFHTLQRYDEAIADFDQAIERDPNLVDAYKMRGNTFYGLKRYESALQDFSKMIELNPQDATAYFERGKVYQQQKLLDQAIQDFQAALQIDSSLIAPIINIGLIEYEQGNSTQALKQFQQAIQLDASIAESKLAYATVLYKTGNPSQAKKLAQEALELDPNFKKTDHLRLNLWGETLIQDTQKMLTELL